LNYFNNVFFSSSSSNFSGPAESNCLEVYEGVRHLLDCIKKYLKLCSEDERKSYGRGTT